MLCPFLVSVVAGAVKKLEMQEKLTANS